MFQKGARFFKEIVIIVVSLFVMVGCGDIDYEPATVEFTNPINGSVYPFGTESVTIQGKVVAGDNAPIRLEVEHAGATPETVSFETDGTFEYNFFLDQTKIYSTCTFKVTDAEMKFNKRRISFAIGDAIDITDVSIADDAKAGLSISEDLIRAGSPTLEDGTKTAILNMIDYMLPMDEPILPQWAIGEFMGDLVINPNAGGILNGYIRIGDIDISLDVKAGNAVIVSASMVPSDDLAYGIYVRGYHRTAIYNPLTQDYFKNVFTLSSQTATLNNIELSFDLNSNDQMTVSADFSNADLTLTGANMTYGLLTAPLGLLDMLSYMMESVFRSASFENSPFMNINDYTSFSNPTMTGEIVIDDANFIISSEDAVRIDVGLNFGLVDYNNLINPGLMHFLYTPGDLLPGGSSDPLPAYMAASHKDIIVSMSDDLINQTAFLFTQAGTFHESDMTESLMKVLPVIERWNKNASASVSIDTPPIVDLSGNEMPNSGVLHIPNVFIEIDNYKVTQVSSPTKAWFSIDVIAAIDVKLSEDKKKIIAGLDKANSELNTELLYCSDSAQAFILNALMPLAEGVGLAVVDNVLSSIVKQDLPGNDVWNHNTTILYTETGIADNCVIIPIDVDL